MGGREKLPIVQQGKRPLTDHVQHVDLTSVMQFSNAVYKLIATRVLDPEATRELIRGATGRKYLKNLFYRWDPGLHLASHLIRLRLDNAFVMKLLNHALSMLDDHLAR
jgi:hypothetical protein